MDNLFTLQNRQFFESPVSDRVEIVHDIRKIVAMSIIARREGILAIEGVMKNEDVVFLLKGLSLLVDGSDPVLLDEILSGYIVSSGHVGAKLLRLFVIKRGLLALQDGEHPRIIEEMLLSCIGEDAAKLAEEKFPQAEFPSKYIRPAPDNLWEKVLQLQSELKAAQQELSEYEQFPPSSTNLGDSLSCIVKTIKELEKDDLNAVFDHLTDKELCYLSLCLPAPVVAKMLSCISVERSNVVLLEMFNEHHINLDAMYALRDSLNRWFGGNARNLDFIQVKDVAKKAARVLRHMN